MVQDVEEFRTELQTLTFVNGRGLQQREIHRVILRANQRVPACSPVDAERGIGKHARIVPESRGANRCARSNGAAANAVAAGRIVALAGHQVGSISRAASKSAYRQTITRKRSGADTERYAGLAFDDAAHLPSADQLPCYTRCLEREIVSVVHVEAV